MTRYHDLNVGDDSPQLESLLKTAIDTALRHTWTAIPGIIKGFDSTKQTAEVKVSIKQGYTTIDGDVKYREHPVLINVPVFFLGGGGFYITHNLNVGDPGIVIFSSRCIDSWHSNGDVQKPSNTRKHSFADGIFIPGIRPLPQKIESFDIDGLMIRNNSGSINMKVNDTGIEINGNVVINGDFKATGGEFKHDNVHVGNKHRHPKGDPCTGKPGAGVCLPIP
jgi:hypothetical protein